MKKSLFSLVVCVYNVEEYLKRCLESIDKQYRNFEVIIIDDGSTDHSGYICDEWSVDKDYVKVYHQSNQGISKARNSGVQYSKGEYILFIDPDDWVTEDYTRTLEKLIQQNGGSKQVDIIGLGFNEKDDSRKILKEFTKYPKSHASGHEVLRWLLNGEVGTYAWQFAIKKDLFKNYNIKFPNMILYEDGATIYRLLYFANKIVLANKPIYVYFQRTNSFLHTPTIYRTTEYLNLFKQMDLFFKEQKRTDLLELSKNFKLPRLFSAYLNIIRLDISKKEKIKYEKEISKMIKKNYTLHLTDKSTLIKEILFYLHLFKPVSYVHDWLEKWKK